MPAAGRRVYHLHICVLHFNCIFAAAPQALSSHEHGEAVSAGDGTRHVWEGQPGRWLAKLFKSILSVDSRHIICYHQITGPADVDLKKWRAPVVTVVPTLGLAQDFEKIAWAAGRSYI